MATEKIFLFTWPSALISTLCSSVVSGGQFEGSLSQIAWTMFPEEAIHCISSSTPQEGGIIFRWDVMPLDVVVLLDLVRSV